MHGEDSKMNTFMGLIEYHRVNKNTPPVLEIGEMVLIVGEEKEQRTVDERKSG